MKFLFPIQVYYEDTDAGGVVYHSNYLNFMERARTEAIRSLGFELDSVARELGVIFVVRRVEVDYLAPARFNDRLVVSADFTSMRNTSMLVNQQVKRVEDSKLLTDGSVQVVAIKQENLRPTSIPQPIVEQLFNAE